MPRRHPSFSYASNRSLELFESGFHTQAIGSLHSCRWFSLRQSYKFLLPARANVSSQLESARKRQTVSPDFSKCVEIGQKK